MNSRVYLAPSMFVHSLIRVSVLGVALPTSSAFISVEVTNLHGEAWCCLSLHVRLAWGGTESVDVLGGRAPAALAPESPSRSSRPWNSAGENQTILATARAQWLFDSAMSMRLISPRIAAARARAQGG